jgi:phosphate transport system substrate-binding protein
MENGMKLKLLVAALVSLAICIAIFVGGRNHYGEDGKPDDVKVTATSNTRWLSAGGSTFIEPLIDRWDSDYGKSHSLHINYLPVGSGGGIDRLRKGYGAFAASDAPLADDQLRDLPPIVQFPVTAGPVCVTYNLPGLKTALRLSGTTLAGIYAGVIVGWQDPAIARDNPGIAIPHAGIIVVHRSDGSGTTSIFTNYLSKVSETWKAKGGGQGLSVNWPIGIGENGSSAVLSAVKGSVGAIGYLELAYAKGAGMPVASIQNRAGDFIAPSPASAFLAVNASIDVLAKDLRTPIIDPPATANGAYPITGLSFILIPKDNKGLPGDQAALRDYIAYALSTGQEVAEELSYAKLPPPVQQQGQALLSQLTQNGQPLR